MRLGGGGGVRAETAWRISMDWDAIRVQGEVTVSVDDKLRGAVDRNSIETDHSWDRTSREDC